MYQNLKTTAMTRVLYSDGPLSSSICAFQVKNLNWDDHKALVLVVDVILGELDIWLCDVIRSM